MRTTAVLSVLGVCAGFASADIAQVSFPLSGDQQVAAGDDSAFGTGSIDFDLDAKTFDITIFVGGITLSELNFLGAIDSPLHIHQAPAGSNGPIVIDLYDFGSFVEFGTGIAYSANGIDASGNLQAFEDGNLYVNVHTFDFPGGAIRGQIPAIAGAVPAPAGAGLLAASGLALAARRRR